MRCSKPHVYSITHLVGAPARAIRATLLSEDPQSPASRLIGDRKGGIDLKHTSRRARHDAGGGGSRRCRRLADQQCREGPGEADQQDARSYYYDQID